MGLLDLIRRNIGLAPRVDDTATGTQPATPGDEPNPTQAELKKIAAGALDPRGFSSDAEAVHRSAKQRTGQGVVGSTVAAAMLAQKSAAPIRPLREAFASAEAFDAAFLAYQDARMAKLAGEHPGAFFAGPVNHGTNTSPAALKARGGLPPKGAGDNFDLRAHQRNFVDPNHPELGSALRGSCQDMRVPAGIAGEGGFVYELVPRGGAVSVMDALKHDDLIPAELELAFGARQPWHRIKGWRQIGAYSDPHSSFRLGPYVANPDFDPTR